MSVIITSFPIYTLFLFKLQEILYQYTANGSEHTDSDRHLILTKLRLLNLPVSLIA